MERSLLKTADGSNTLHIAEWNEQYHSKNGALAEAVHVFIKSGLKHWSALNSSTEISVMEIGFGTGLNCILTFLEAQRNGWNINYKGVEAFPLDINEVRLLDYPSILNQTYSNRPLKEIEEVFYTMHTIPWEKIENIAAEFTLLKQKKFFSEITDSQQFNLIYFDAFGIRVQPELWTEDIFQKMFNALKVDGVLVTYASNGKARRALQNVGFSVQKLPGPPGKREMLRASKTR